MIRYPPGFLRQHRAFRLPQRNLRPETRPAHWYKRIAADCLGVDLGVIVTAERAGFYKPDPRPYRLALEELKVDPEYCLFVAGSSYDVRCELSPPIQADGPDS